MTTTHRSSRRSITPLSSPKSTSVASVRSCASSRITQLYRFSCGSFIASLKSIPSVMYLSTVLGDVLSSKRIVYPTCSPSVTSISSATRRDTDIAATRRGCVHAHNRCVFARPASTTNCGICVVLPLPVSPTRTMVLVACSSARKSSFCCHTGKCLRVHMISWYRELYCRPVKGFTSPPQPRIAEVSAVHGAAAASSPKSSFRLRSIATRTSGSAARSADAALK
mmetsp:Transcript_9713/g.33852  ORF Transcript_9713/g.33852 Transcript_9713/m.33852 type:complete len:224 (+) Transcript_9713:1758-2429(+)